MVSKRESLALFFLAAKFCLNQDEFNFGFADFECYFLGNWGTFLTLSKLKKNKTKLKLEKRQILEICSKKQH